MSNNPLTEIQTYEIWSEAVMMMKALDIEQLPIDEFKKYIEMVDVDSIVKRFPKDFVYPVVAYVPANPFTLTKSERAARRETENAAILLNRKAKEKQDLEILAEHNERVTCLLNNNNKFTNYEYLKVRAVIRKNREATEGQTMMEVFTSPLYLKCSTAGDLYVSRNKIVRDLEMSDEEAVKKYRNKICQMKQNHPELEGLTTLEVYWHPLFLQCQSHGKFFKVLGIDDE
jgi:hypothetical protein